MRPTATNAVSVRTVAQRLRHWPQRRTGRAEAVDARSSGYARDDWHRHLAERMIASCARPAGRVLDAATGTGFTAAAVARLLSRSGHVIGVDISPGMLREARVAVGRASRVVFSSMLASSPRAGGIFRTCAREFGVALADPSEPLGSPAACRQALATAGFEVLDVVGDVAAFAAVDPVGGQRSLRRPPRRATSERH